MKNILATITLLAVLAFGSNLAYGGLLVSDFTGGSDQTQPQQPCTASDDIIVPTGLTIIVPTGFVGIIINEIIKDEEPSDCIIVPIG